MDRDNDSPSVSNSISVGLASAVLGSSAPVNIPGANRSGLGAFSPNSSPLQHLQSSFFPSRFAQQDPNDFFNHSGMQLSSSASKMNYCNFLDFGPRSISPNSRNHNNLNMSPSVNSHNMSNFEVTRLREELSNTRLQLSQWEERLGQARTACEAWQREAEESSRKLKDALTDFSNLKQQYDSLQADPLIHTLGSMTDLTKLSLSDLKNIKSKLKSDLEEVDKVLYRETASKCMVCEERNRTITLNCNHFVLCSVCALTQRECPYCQTPVDLANNM